MIKFENALEWPFPSPPPPSLLMLILETNGKNNIDKNSIQRNNTYVPVITVPRAGLRRWLSTEVHCCTEHSGKRIVAGVLSVLHNFRAMRTKSPPFDKQSDSFRPPRKIPIGHSQPQLERRHCRSQLPCKTSLRRNRSETLTTRRTVARNLLGMTSKVLIDVRVFNFCNCPNAHNCPQFP